MPPLLQYGAGTHVGLIRDNNEDCYLSRPDIGLWLIADGMGGHDAGEVASGIARDHINKAVTDGSQLKQAIAGSHHAVKNAAANNIGSPNMGTTLVALKVKGIQYQIAWVGDSRAYLWNKNCLKQISIDHSYVQELLDSGAISKDEMHNHSQKNIITQSIGISNIDNVKVDEINGVFAPGHKILLCSDGLSDLVEDDDIEDIISRTYEEDQVLVDRLISKALENGGTDNVTVQLISAASQDTLSHEIQRAFLNSPLSPLVRHSKTFRWLAVGLCIGLGAVLIKLAVG